MAWRHYGGNKYGNHKVVVDGSVYDSKKEARRWLELKCWEAHGVIKDLERQKKFILIPAQFEPDIIGPRGGRKRGKLLEHEVAYYADFCYTDAKTGEYIVEDAKSPITRENAQYIIKRKLMLYIHHIRIREV